jgi:formate--tetrahydrofolate ligase
LLPLPELAARYGIPPEALIPYGHTRAKLHLDARPASPRKQRARYVLVTAITPTPAGEGKTVHTIGLSLALARLGHKAVCTIRQPSMGPVFGIKGGAAGGGQSQVVPMEDFNLHLTGDFHAVAAANNLLAAAIDTSILLDNPLGIVPESVRWRRVVDVNDRALREIEIGLGGPKNGVPRKTGFDITPASEVMAILGLARDLVDLRTRLARIVVGERADGSEVTAGELEVAGAMAALLGEAIHPTLMQTTEGTLAFVHTGPFANIAHGNSSIIADQLAARFFDYVVTEAGFAADMGAEKFFDIKCRTSGMAPDCAVVVATVRALKVHSGRFDVVQGKPLPRELAEENLDALAAGCANLEAQIANVRAFGVPVIVAVNRFGSDTQAELELVRERALEAGAEEACTSDVFGRGGEGGRELAEAVHRAAHSGKARFKPLYELSESLQAKVERLATRIYGADGVDFSERAQADLARLEKAGHAGLPICVAKSQYSLSHDPTRKGRPRGYRFPVRELRLSAGAGFVVVLAGDIMTMPGLGRNPGYKRVDLDAEGRVRGLF